MPNSKNTHHEELNRKQRHREPLAWCKFVVHQPKIAFGITLGGHVFLTLLNIILYLAGYNIFPFDFYNFPVTLKDQLTVQREDAWKYRNNDDPDRMWRFTVDDLGTPPYRGYVIDEPKFYYLNHGENVFQQDLFRLMENMEDSVAAVLEESEFCHLTELRQCEKPKSLLRYFDGSMSHISPTFYDPEYMNISTVLFEAYTHPRTSNDFKYFLGKGCWVEKTGAFCNLTRVAFQVGWPIPNNSTRDPFWDILMPFYREQLIPVIDKEAKIGNEKMEVYYFSFNIFNAVIFREVAGSMLLAVGSLIFIFFFIRMVTRSFWITSWAVASIISSFFITNLIYRIVLDYIYLGYLHLMSIFVILGIGADDIFVYFNTWDGSFVHEYPSMTHRLSHVFRTASGTMLFTSVTTMLAFIAGGLTPILGLGSFGIFTGVLIFVNYISVVVFFPVVVYTHHLYFAGQPKSRGTDTGKNIQETSAPAHVGGMPSQMPELHEQKYSLSTQAPILDTDANGLKSEMSNEPTNVSLSSQYSTENLIKLERSKSQESMRKALHSTDDLIVLECDTKQPNRIRQFFKGPYFNFVSNKYVSVILILVMLSFTGICAWSASNIQVDSEEVKIFVPRTNYGTAMRLEGNGFIPSGDDFVRITISWGIGPRDFSSCHKTDYKCRGEPRWDDGFNMNTPVAQQALQEFCWKLRYNLTLEESEKLMVRKNHITGVNEIDCFMDNLQEYLGNEEKRLNDSVNLRYPLTETNMETYMALNPAIYEPEKLPATFYRYFELAVGNWLTQKYTMRSSPDYFLFDPLVGESLDGDNSIPPKFHAELNASNRIWYGTKLRYIGIRVNLSLETQELGYQQGLPVMDEWNEFLDAQMSAMPFALQRGFQSTELTWQWLLIQRTLVWGAAIGITVGVLIAYPILVLATMNIIIGSFAVLNIICISICVIGVIPAAGWKLDVMVSMNLCLLVGLSVDYVVHLAEGYHLSTRPDRLGRVQDMLENLGVSVLSGACTTLGAAIFMMFAKIQFFFQFGTFLLCTIGFSLVFSLAFFTSVMSLCGPEDNTGSVIPPFRRAWYYCKGRGSHDKECEMCEGKGFVEDKDVNNYDNSSQMTVL